MYIFFVIANLLFFHEKDKGNPEKSPFLAFLILLSADRVYFERKNHADRWHSSPSIGSRYCCLACQPHLLGAGSSPSYTPLAMFMHICHQPARCSSIPAIGKINGWGWRDGQPPEVRLAASDILALIRRTQDKQSSSHATTRIPSHHATNTFLPQTQTKIWQHSDTYERRE